jgi:hypothetical protein
LRPKGASMTQWKPLETSGNKFRSAN